MRKISAAGWTAIFAAVSTSLAASPAATPDGPTSPAGWIRGGGRGAQPYWGLRDGLQFAIPPASVGPRGLIRLLYPTLPGGRYDLINFIAVEPIVRGQRGYSELEPSRLDGVPGKRFWVEPGALSGESSRAASGVESLKVVIRIEPFNNGAHLRLIAEQRSDRPDELALTVEAEADSAPLEYCILTATMGNKARARELWLKDESVSSLKIYPAYRGPDFAETTVFPRSKIALTADADLLAAITTDEQRPAEVRPFPGRDAWYYGGLPVTQYWRKAKGTWRPDLHLAVNARYTYWQSRQAIPGGISFENFELRERFHPGQTFIFGITRRTPAELGLGSHAAGQSATHTTASRPSTATAPQ